MASIDRLSSFEYTERNTAQEVFIMSKQPTQIVRDAMKEFGHHSEKIFTNKYDTCRTVKCYGIDPATTQRIRHRLQEHCYDLKDFTIKHKRANPDFWLPLPSVTIVRIPFSVQPENNRSNTPEEPVVDVADDEHVDVPVNPNTNESATYRSSEVLDLVAQAIDAASNDRDYKTVEVLINTYRELNDDQ